MINKISVVNLTDNIIKVFVRTIPLVILINPAIKLAASRTANYRPNNIGLIISMITINGIRIKGVLRHKREHVSLK